MYKCPNCKHEFELQNELTQCPQCNEAVDLPTTLDASDDEMSTSSDQDFELQMPTGDEETFAETIGAEHKDDLLLPRAPIDSGTRTQDVDSAGFADTEKGTVDHGGVEESDDEDTEVATEIYDPEEKQPTMEVGDSDRSTKTLDYAERMIAGLGERLDGDADYIISMDEEDSELGSGASGVVYKATQKSLDRTVAIKLLKKQVQKSGTQTTSRKTTPKPKDVEKFLYESQITAGLDHPNVITVHDLGVTANDTLFYSMKLFEGGRDWSKDFERNSLEQNLDIFNDVCDAIRRAHRDRIIHRDLKPQNVLVGDFGEVQVTDWGLAIDLRRQENLPFSGGGTPCYMAPEMALHYLSQQEAKTLKAKLDWSIENAKDGPETDLIREKLKENEYKEQKYRLQISELSDIYVLGAILFQIAAGYPPHLFQVSDAQRKQWGGQAGRNKVRRELEMAATRTIARYMVRGLSNVEAREALRDIAMKAMGATPSERFQNVAALQQAVRDFRDFMRCIEDTHRGHREIESSEDDPKSYVNLTNAIYAFEGALESYPDYEPALDGHAKAKFLFAERALNNQDFELGLSTMTAEAIKAQPDEILATRLRNELVTQRNRRDRRKRLLFVATMASLVAIAVGVISGVFAYVAQQEAIRQNAIAEQKKQQAEQAEQRELKARADLVEGLTQIVDTKEKVVDLKVEAEIIKDRLALSKRKTSAAGIQTSIAELNSKYVTLQSADQANLARIQNDILELETELANLARIEAEIDAERIKETTQFDQYVNRLKSIEADIDEDITQSRLADLFQSADISLEVKNGWELHHLYKRANPAKQPVLEKPLGKVKILEASDDGSVIVAVNEQNQLFRGSAANPDLLPFEDLPTRNANIVSIDVSSGGRWLVIGYESILNQSATSKTDSVPVVYDLRDSRVLYFDEQFGEALRFEYVLPDSDGKICKEKYFCNVQHVEFLNDDDRQFRLLMVDQRQSLGLNQLRCSISTVDVVNDKLVADVKKVKVAGQLFLKEPGVLSGARCIAAATVDHDNSTKIAIVNSFPEFSLLTYSFEDALGIFQESVGQDATPRDEARYFSAMNRSRIELDEISPGFAPTAMDFVRDDAGRSQLVLGNGKGEIASVKFHSQYKDDFMLAASNAKILDPVSAMADHSDSRILTSETVRVTVTDNKAQRVSDRSPASRRQLQSGRGAIHKTAIRSIESLDRRFVSVSESEMLIWEFASNDPTVVKRLFGQSGNVADMVIARNDAGMKLFTVSNKLSGDSELRPWTPDSTVHDATIRLTDFRSESNTNKKIVSGAADERPGSSAIALGFDDGSVEYFSPENGSVLLLKSGADQGGDQDELSLNDFRNGKFEYFEDRNQLVMYSNSVGLLIWNLNDEQQTDPIRPPQSAEYFRGKPSNSSVFLSSDSAGRQLVTSHPRSRDKVLLWRRDSNDEFIVREIGPFTKDGATSRSGLNIFVQPTVSPDGRVIAAVLRLRNGYQLQLIDNSDSRQATPMATFDSPSRTSFRSIHFLGNDRIIVSSDRVERGVEREIGMVEFTRTPAGWRDQALDLPDSLSDDFRQLSLEHVDLINGELTFVGFGIERTPDSEIAAYTNTSKKSCIEAENSRELLVWNSDGIILRRDLPFSRRIAPRIDGGTLSYMVAGVHAGHTDLHVEQLEDPESEVQVFSLRHNDLNDAATRWQFPGNDRIVYVGRDWFHLARRNGNRLTDDFEFSLANPAEKLQLAGRMLLVHNEDGSGSVIQLDAENVKNKPQIQRLNGFKKAAALSPDGSRLATIDMDGDLVLSATQEVMRDQQQVIKKLQNDAIAMTWIRAQALANLGVADVRGDCLVSLSRVEDGLQLRFWAVDGRSVMVPDSVSMLPLNPVPAEEVKSFDIAGVSGRLLAIVWDSNAKDRADIFKFAPEAKPDENINVAYQWFPINESNLGQIKSVHFSEPMDPSVDGSNVATRIVIGSEIQGSKAVKLYAVELGLEFGAKPLLELYVSDKLQQVDEIIDSRFSGDGKSLLTMTSETAQLRLSDGWSSDKRDVDFSNKVNGFQAKLNSSSREELVTRLSLLKTQAAEFESNSRLKELEQEKQTMEADLIKRQSENSELDHEVNAKEQENREKLEAGLREEITILQSRIDALKGSLNQ